MEQAHAGSQPSFGGLRATIGAGERAASSPAERRLPDLRVLASIGIVLVVVGHSFPDLSAEAAGVGAARTLKTIIYVFHMPLFFYMSGFLLQNWVEARSAGMRMRRLDRLTAGELMARRFRRILVPYAVISTCVFPIKALLAHRAHNPVDFSTLGYLRSLALPPENPIDFFWFLPTLFGVTLIGILLSPLVRERFHLILVAVTAAALVFHHQLPTRSDTLLNVAGALHSFVFFWVGMLHRHFRARVEPMLERLQHPAVIGLLIAAPVAVGLFSLTKLWALQVGASFAGILACLLAARAYVTHELSFLDPLHGQSFRIYLLSWFPQVACRVLLFETGLLGFWPTAACMCVTGLVVPILVGKAAARTAPRLAEIAQI